MLSEAERLGQEVGAIGGVLKPGSLTFLDQRRFNNLAIALTKLAMPNEQIRDAVLAADETILTPDVLELVVSVAPTADDIEAIGPYDGEPILLAKVERFFFDVHKVPHFTNRLLALQGKQRFAAHAAHAHMLLETVGVACAQLSRSTALESLLALVLAAGNALNEGTARGAARGLKLSSLSKLADVKSMAKRGTRVAGGGGAPTLLSMLVSLAEEALPNTAAVWTAGLSGAAAAARVSWDRIGVEIAAMSKGLQMCDRVHKAVAKAAQVKAAAELSRSKQGGARKPAGPPAQKADRARPAAAAEVDGFEASFGAWLPEAHARLGSLRGLLAGVRRLAASCAARFGEEESAGPDELFGMVDGFAAQWVAASAANVEAAARVAREARRAEQSALRERQLAEKREQRERERAARCGAEAEAEGGEGAGKGRAEQKEVLRINLPTDRKKKKGVVGAAREGAACTSCGLPFKGWGRECPACRTSKRKPKVPTGDRCFVCGKRVYDAERLVAGGRLFHKKSTAGTY